MVRVRINGRIKEVFFHFCLNISQGMSATLFKVITLVQYVRNGLLHFYLQQLEAEFSQTNM